MFDCGKSDWEVGEKTYHLHAFLLAAVPSFRSFLELSQGLRTEDMLVMQWEWA